MSISPYCAPGILHHATAETFLQQLLAVMQVHPAELHTRSRKARVVNAERIACHMLRYRYPHLSYADIGRMTGGKGHCNVIYHVRKVDGWLKVDKMFKDYYLSIQKML